MTTPPKSEEQERKVTGKIHVRGEITVEPSEEEKLLREATSNEQQTKDNESKWIARATLGLVTLYASLTWWLGCSTRNMVNYSHDQLVYSQRPWVGPELGETVITLRENDLQVQWDIHFRNFGSSPALKVKMHTHLFAPAERPDFVQIEQKIATLDVSQDGEFNIFNGQSAPNRGFSSARYDVETKEAIKAETFKLVLGGKIVYSDEFGEKDHMTTFCVIYVPSRDAHPESWITCPVKDIAN
ncbi:hypothetical protein [Granulicella sp. dw_53]|uniref:hypothetical protein n=1 Tax=Granulicella sp. dw_53 TaxID=2719792 RepID=UPI001BD44879|nr:hypothetical protein [Granulicella sp. dw_53]